MKPNWLALLLGAMALVCSAAPALAQLSVRDAYGATQLTSEYTDTNGWFHPSHVVEGMLSGQPTQIYAESDHSLDVTIKTTPGLTSAQLTAAGLALHSDMTSLLSSLGAPLQANGYIGNSYFLSDALVVSGDQTFTVGTQQHATMDTNGRWKVGLSSARALGATAAGYSDLAGAIDPSGNQQGNHQDAYFDLKTVDLNSSAALTAAQASKSDLDAINTSSTSAATSASTTATNTGAIATNTGAPGATACATDTGPCSLNALLQRANVLLDVIATTGKTSYNRGGSITAGGTAQTFLAANASRKAWSVQNQSSANLYVSCIATATQDNNSLLITPGQLYETQPQVVDTGACSIIGPTTGQIFYAREF